MAVEDGTNECNAPVFEVKKRAAILIMQRQQTSLETELETSLTLARELIGLVDHETSSSAFSQSVKLQEIETELNEKRLSPKVFRSLF